MEVSKYSRTNVGPNGRVRFQYDSQVMDGHHQFQGGNSDEIWGEVQPAASVSRSTVARFWLSYKLEMVKSFLARAITKKQPSIYMFYTNIALKQKFSLKSVLGHKTLYLNQLTYRLVSANIALEERIPWFLYIHAFDELGMVYFFKTRFHKKQIA